MTDNHRRLLLTPCDGEATIRLLDAPVVQVRLNPQGGRHELSRSLVEVDYEGLCLTIDRAEDGTLSVQIMSEDVVRTSDANDDGTPRVRVWVNDALLHDEEGHCITLERRSGT